MPDRAEGRRNLVIVRAGQSSLHPEWLRGAEERSWDLIVSSYDAEARHAPEPGVTIVYRPGGKWDGLFALLSGSDLFDRYDYFWLPDDDISATADDIERLFAAMRAYDLSVAQPALTRDSYFTHFLFHACPAFELRYTNYIEIMVPCLKSSLLRAIHGEFSGSMSGFGLDYVWCRVDAAGIDRAAIVDSVAVRHTRPIGQNLFKKMSSLGLQPKDEEMLLRRRYGILDPVTPLAYAAIDRRHRRRSGKRQLGLRMAASYLAVLPSFRDRGLAFSKIVQLVRRQFTRPLDLSRLATVEAKESEAALFELS